MTRPAVDVVVPFAGTDEALDELIAKVGLLRLRDGDSLMIVDNRSAPRPVRRSGAVVVLSAPERQTSYHARNRGLAAGSAEWVVFIDADVDPASDLLDRYFETPPSDRTGVLGGAIIDVDGDRTAGPNSWATRYACLRRLLDQDNALRQERPYAQTANCAIRRAALEEVGGFYEELRSGGDAEVCFRIAAAGWKIEGRDGAKAVHRSRTTLRALLRQKAKHGSGAAWLEERYPGFAPRRKLLAMARTSAWSLASGVRSLLRGDRNDALVKFLDPPAIVAFELGRLVPNEPRSRR